MVKTEPELEIGGMKVVRAHIRGTQPQLQHNVATASPLHPLRPDIAVTSGQSADVKPVRPYSRKAANSATRTCPTMYSQ